MNIEDKLDDANKKLREAQAEIAELTRLLTRYKRGLGVILFGSAEALENKEPTWEQTNEH